LVVVAPRWLTPVAGGLLELAARHLLVATVEDGNRVGGAGSRLSQALRDASLVVEWLAKLYGGLPTTVPAGEHRTSS